MQLAQPKRAKLSDQAMESILDQIRRGNLRPGDKLPSLRELVPQLGISQTAIREALRGLVGLGVIDLEAGRGAFVRSVDCEVLINPESLSLLLQRETLLHAIEVRMALEGEAIALAAERATAHDLDEMAKILRRIERGVKSRETSFRHSPQFHVAIAQATHNPLFVNMVKSFVSLLKQGAALGEFVPEAREREYRLHAELYDSIVRRDANEARERMREHLRFSKEHTLKGLSALSCVGHSEELLLHAQSFPTQSVAGT
jgi:GntR family transcriptional repressor for pyruvate dehydrogenase complex